MNLPDQEAGGRAGRRCTAGRRAGSAVTTGVTSRRQLAPGTASIRFSIGGCLHSRASEEATSSWGPACGRGAGGAGCTRPAGWQFMCGMWRLL